MADEAIQSYAIVNSKGEVVFEFKGVINAQGLILPRGTFATIESEKESQVAWASLVKVINSFIAVGLGGGEPIGTEAMFAKINQNRTVNFGAFILEVFGIAAKEFYSGIHAEAGSTGTASTFVRAKAGQGVKVFNNTIINAAGQSDYLQLIETLARKINFGSTVVEWAGGVNATKEATISHGLGTTPLAVLVSAESGLGAFAEYKNAGATTFKVLGQDPFGFPGAGTKCALSWCAIG